MSLSQNFIYRTLAVVVIIRNKAVAETKHRDESFYCQTTFAIQIIVLPRKSTQIVTRVQQFFHLCSFAYTESKESSTNTVL